MIPYKELTITYRDAPPLMEPPPPIGSTPSTSSTPSTRSERIRVVELPFATVYECCTLGLDDTRVAEAAVRRQTTAGVFGAGVPPGWLKTLDDDSAAVVLSEALKLNLEPPGRAKKLAGLIGQRNQIVFGQPDEISTASGEPSSSS